MTTSGKPQRTYIGVVRTWECDENEHLNLGFYIRAFQDASEAFAILVSGRNPGASTAVLRHLRFHRELLVSKIYTIDSTLVLGGEYDGAIVHLLKSDGVLCATALDRPGYDITGSTPRWEQPVGMALALPRGLAATPHSSNDKKSPDAAGLEAQLGIVRPDEVDHTGQLMMHELFAFCTLSSLHMLHSIGLSSEWRATSACTHMGVEVKVTRHGDCRPGDALRSRSWISPIGSKALSLRHVVCTQTGAPVASVQQVLVVVNSTARRAVALPDFLQFLQPA
ncbi:thioesterase family protein [Mesorhizobium sp. A556]